jgi:transcriptional antiterminator NusG
MVEEINNNTDESRWYILHTYSGHEDKVMTNLTQRVENLDLSKTIHEVLVPSEKN